MDGRRRQQQRVGPSPDRAGLHAQGGDARAPAANTSRRWLVPSATIARDSRVEPRRPAGHELRRGRRRARPPRPSYSSGAAASNGSMSTSTSAQHARPRWRARAPRRPRRGLRRSSACPARGTARRPWRGASRWVRTGRLARILGSEARPARRARAAASATVRDEHRDAVEARAGRHDAARAHEPARRLEADELVEGGRDAARTRPCRCRARRRPRRGRRPPPSPSSSRRCSAWRRTRSRRRRRASGCRPGRSRTGRGWSCRRASRRPRAAGAPPARCPAGASANPGSRPSWADRRRRCCP